MGILPELDKLQKNKRQSYPIITSYEIYQQYIKLYTENEILRLIEIDEYKRDLEILLKLIEI